MPFVPTCFKEVKRQSFLRRLMSELFLKALLYVHTAAADTRVYDLEVPGPVCGLVGR